MLLSFSSNLAWWHSYSFLWTLYLFIVFQTCMIFIKTSSVNMAEPYFIQQNIYGKNCGMFFINMVAPRVSFPKNMMKLYFPAIFMHWFAKHCVMLEFNHRYWCIRAPLLSYHAVRSILITESYTLLLYFSSECPQWFMKEVKHITIVSDIDNNWERGSNEIFL